MALMWRCFTILLTIPQAVELSVMTGVGGWGWPVSSLAKHSSPPLCVLTYSAPISASAAEDMMFLNTSHPMWTGPFGGGGQASSLLGSVNTALT
eukprot:3346216-Ditylum_brightwellii.AAC.1